MASCGVLHTWRLYFFLTFVVVGMWFLIRPDLTDFTVYVRVKEVIKSVFSNDTYTSIPSMDNILKKVNASILKKENRLVQNVEITGRGFVPCKGNATWDAYGESGCPDNSYRDNFCHLLRAWITAARKYNVSYTLGYGSLIGVLRNNDLIPWDTDVDINIDVKFFPLLQKWEKEKMFTKLDGTIRLATQPGPVNNVPEEKRTRHNCEGKVTSYYSDMCSFLEPMARLIRGGNFLDFFHYIEKDDVVEENAQGDLKKHKKKDFFPFRPCVFMGFSTSCPNRPLKILRTCYKTNSDFEKPPKICKNGKWIDN